MTQITRRQKEIVTLVEEVGSVGRAGEILGISYNAASKHVRRYRRITGEKPIEHRPPDGTATNDPAFTHITPRQREVKALFDEMGSQSAVARHLGLSTVTVREKLIQYERNRLRDEGARVLTLEEMSQGRISTYKGGRPSSIKLMGELDNVHVIFPQTYDDESADDGDDEDEVAPSFVWRRNIEPRRIPPPKSGVFRALLTGAQDATDIHEPFWRNLQAYATDLGAEVIVSGFTYNKALFTNQETAGNYWRPELEPHLFDNRVQFGDAMDFAGEMNTLPTAVTPLSGMHAYTGPRWGIFPHAKQALESIPRMKDAPYKATMTTGCCTLPNYVSKKAGLKAESWHTIGCVILEMLPDGRCWARHIEADPDTGTFRDLDVLVEDGLVSRGHRVEAIQAGDVHHEKLDPEVARATWGYDPKEGRVRRKWERDSLVGRLRPRHQFFHDLSDFAPRNHHNIKNHLWRLLARRLRCDDVEHELKRCALFLKATRRDDCTSVVIQSNHDNALTRWLDEADYREEDNERNVLFFLRTQHDYYKRTLDSGRKPHIFEDVLRGFVKDRLTGVHFITEDDSYVIAGGIECSQHGHLGPNGSRGSAVNLSRMSPKMNIGHGHAPAVRDGLWMAGACALDMGYNKGPSSWAVAHIITHVDGTRQLLFMNGGRFHA